MPSYGFAGYFGVGRETSWGSGVAATDFVEILNENLSLTIDRFPYKNVHNSFSEPDDIAGVRRVAGSVSFAAHPENVGFFLKSLFNRSDVTSITSDFFNHSFLPPTTTQSAFSDECPSVPYTLEIFRDVVTAQQYMGCIVSALSFNFAPNRDVRCSAEFIGRGTNPASQQTATFPNSPTKPFKFDQVSLQLAGAANTRIEELTVNLSNQYDGIPVLNQSDVIGKIRRTGHFMVEVSGTLEFEDLDEYNDFVNQTERQLIVSALSANSFQINIDIPRLVYTAFPLGLSGSDRTMVGFTAKGFHNVSSGTSVEVNLFCVSSYF